MANEYICLMRMSSEDLELLVLTIVPLVVAVCGIVVLYCWLRGFSRFLRAKPSKWNGQVFDSGRLMPRVAQVRQNYLSALRSRRHPLFHAETLLAAARTMVRHLRYFQDTSAIEPKVTNVPVPDRKIEE